MSFVGRINKRKETDKIFSQGVDEFKRIRTNHRDTIIDLLQLAYQDYAALMVKDPLEKNKETKEKFALYTDAENLLVLFSSFFPVTKSIFSPMKDSDRIENSLEQMQRFKEQIDNTHFLSGAKKESQDSHDSIERILKYVEKDRITPRIMAWAYRKSCIMENNMSDRFQKSVNAFNKIILKMHVQNPEIYHINGKDVIGIELRHKADRMFEDLKQFNAEFSAVIFNTGKQKQ